MLKILKKEATDIFEGMERKLYNYIMRPAMLFSWIFGISFNLFKWIRCINLIYGYKLNSLLVLFYQVIMNILENA